MTLDFSIEDAVRGRTSVRNYAPRAPEDEKMAALAAFAASLKDPFGGKVRFHFLDGEALPSGERLGTYGVIKGARHYLGASVPPGPMALESLGYQMETLILCLAHLGLGSCWLGGTFKRKAFAKAMAIGDDHLFPAMTPFGYPAGKKHMTETLMRRMIGADQRKPWEHLFFQDDFQTPLRREAAGELTLALEMLRLGPSASNKQPWRILMREGAWHFYLDKAPGYSDAFPYDIQRLDMGIAAAHFDHAVKEKGIRGHFETAREPLLAVPAGLQYRFTWREA